MDFREVNLLIPLFYSIPMVFRSCVLGSNWEAWQPEGRRCYTKASDAPVPSARWQRRNISVRDVEKVIHNAVSCTKHHLMVEVSVMNVFDEEEKGQDDVLIIQATILQSELLTKVYIETTYETEGPNSHFCWRYWYTTRCTGSSSFGGNFFLICVLKIVMANSHLSQSIRWQLSSRDDKG